jgi:anti-sigma regulatory factor (Ser/Thr protein kinase)
VVQAVDLPGDASSVRTARRFVRASLEAAELGELDDLVDTALLLISELATNAVLHARSGYRVEVAIVEGAARFSVLDDSPVLVHRRVNRLEAATGRGLGMVEALATRWGPTGTDDLQGRAKGIWFELPTDPVALRSLSESIELEVADS